MLQHQEKQQKDKNNDTPNQAEDAANFETAISETKFGLFNLILLLVTIPSVYACQIESSSLSFVFPAAQCDLNLSLQDRGLINAVTYVGMIGSSFMWGPLIDVFGRRKILIIGHLLDGIFVVMVVFSTNLGMLITSKLFGGFLINGPGTAMTPYLSEFHGKNNRPRIPLMLGFLYSTANIVMPLFAWLILPLNIKFSLVGFELHGWNVFLLICVLPTFLSGFLFISTPETPKYLMSKADNSRALKVFQKIFQLNTRQSKNKYPIKKLIDDRQIYQKENRIKTAWQQLTPLFSPKYIAKLINVCLLQLFLMMCVNSLRLWLPQIFQSMNDLKRDQNTSLCTILKHVEGSTDTDDTTCSMNIENASTYTNMVIVGATSVVGYITAVSIINRIGKKKLLIPLSIISGVTAMSIYFSSNSATMLSLICVHLMCTNICIDIVIAAVVDIFPTYLRASALSLALTCGRIGSVIGNLVFPMLLQANCGAVFFTIGGLVIGCAILSFFLPNTDNVDLQ